MTGRIKRSVLILTAFCLVSVGVVGTNAYFSDREQADNKLSVVGEDGLNAILSEPSCKADKGICVVPNTVILKDPQVTNTSDIDLDELVALKCEFVYTASCPDSTRTGTLLNRQDMLSVAEVFDIDYNSDDPGKEDWVRFDGQKKTDPLQCFYYRKTLKRNGEKTGDTTVPLFTRLKIEKSTNNRQFSKIQEIGGFDIRISGQVLQQMTGETYFGLHSAENAFRAGLFDFQSK